MTIEFSEVVSSEEELRDVIGNPSHRALRKQMTHLDEHARAFIAKCPFLLISSCDGEGRMDISQKGDPQGFVQVLDDQTLAIPDRLGNRRADTFGNLLRNPNVGLLFLIPGKQETLRVSGTARIVRDLWVRQPMAVSGKIPDLAIIVSVREMFFHCPKCVIRSKIWEQEAWPQLDGLPSLARAMVDEGKLEESLDEMRAIIEKDARERLY
jgi:PPOX class probable FMN-dependent enzyme